MRGGTAASNKIVAVQTHLYAFVFLIATPSNICSLKTDGKKYSLFGTEHQMNDVEVRILTYLKEVSEA